MSSEVTPVVIKEVSLNGFVERVRVDGSSKAGGINAKRVQKRKQFGRDCIGVTGEGVAKTAGAMLDNGGGNRVPVDGAGEGFNKTVESHSEGL